MPRIFDNIEKSLLPALQETLNVAEQADSCVGYFNLRGWRHLADHVDRWTGTLGLIFIKYVSDAFNELRTNNQL